MNAEEFTRALLLIALGVGAAAALVGFMLSEEIWLALHGYA
jgi:hypothetical protein